MKKIILLFAIALCFKMLVFSQAITTNPTPIEVDKPVTITVYVNSTSTDCNKFVNPAKVYMHAGIGNDLDPWGFKVIGNWGQDDGIGLMTNNGNGTWSITLTPQTYFNLTPTQITTASKMGMVFRNETGSQEFKDNGCKDFIRNVGAFQVTMSFPSPSNPIGSTTTGGSFLIMANNSNGSADYVLKANNIVINSQSGISTYIYNHSGITVNTNYELSVTQGTKNIKKYFGVLIEPSGNSATLPGGLVEGINYNPSDPTKATLVLSAPVKDFVYVAGSFNNYNPTLAYAMKKDPNTGVFWLELTNLNAGEIYTYQYWVFKKTPLLNSPNLVKTADPYSTLVLSPFDDPWIAATTYPNLPAYPAGQEREVTVLQTNQTTYNWQVTNFTKPSEEDLIVYEVLIRDFDNDRNIQDLIDKIDYFKNLKINAIELMPVMEYEGNESWGYNTAFHMALDKFYGTSDKFKEFVDVCHQNGIAVILDVALNHAFGRNPMNRMWMVDSNYDGWGDPSSENPYFNTVAKHSYSVGSDFNHSSQLTKNYVKRVVKHWIQEYKIDGFRWDLTKGFTQNCENNQGCTDSYQADRVAVLKEYADYSWSLDPNHYVIFEHLGADNEEAEWANYRLNEGKGIMLWGKMVNPYGQLTMGYATDSNFDRMGHKAHTGFNGKRVMGYAESHDEERLMYKNLTYGNTTNPSHNVKDLNTALSRMSALGAVTLTIPGPKMIWHFGDLGMNNSIWTCQDGSIDIDDPTISNDPDCKLSTKPQPQWVNDWLNVTERKKIFNDWSRINALKIQEPVFEGDYSISSGSLTPRIYVWNDALTSDQLKNVVVLANFDVTSQNIVPNFPYTGTWYNLMDNTSLNVTNTTAAISIEAGGFRIYGNKQTTLANEEELINNSTQLYPNPTKGVFSLNREAEKIQVFDTAGKLVKQFNGNSKNSYDVSDLKPSIYFVRIQTNKGVNTQQLILNK